MINRAGRYHARLVVPKGLRNEIRNSPSFAGFGQIGIDDLLVQRLRVREAIAGLANDDELGALVGAQLGNPP